MLGFIGRWFRHSARSAARDAAFREISELDAYALAGRSECPVLGKVESMAQKAAVCLKRMPVGYVLGISDSHHALRLWYTADLGAAWERFSTYVERMQISGSPFGNASSVLSSPFRSSHFRALRHVHSSTPMARLHAHDLEQSHAAEPDCGYARKHARREDDPEPRSSRNNQLER